MNSFGCVSSSLRAITLQDDLVLTADNPSEVDSKRLARFMRYQTTHQHAYYKAQKELRNLNKQKQKGADWL